MKIVLHVKGGLGNQLIQYAFVQKYFPGKTTEIIFDSSHFKFLKERQFFLQAFPHKKTSRWSRLFLLAKIYFKIIFKKLHGIGLMPYSRIVLHNYIDDDFDFSKVNNIKSKYVYVNGYFQHLELFPLPANSDFINFLDRFSRILIENETFQLIKNTDNPIMLHLRRGDYVSNEIVKMNMGQCGQDYFRRGIDLISKDLETYTLFVFSDDTEYAASIFNEFKPIHFVKGDTFNPLQDFLLMRCFRYAVISNSTLSFMASMLSTYDDNVVVIPEPWFENGNKFLLGTKKQWKYVAKYQ